MKGIVYLAEDLRNGLCYIGQTTNLDRRMKEHKQKAYQGKSGPLYEAIRIGHPFMYEILEEYESNDESKLRIKLNERESYYIAIRNTYFGPGYNCDLGGINKWNSKLTSAKTHDDKFDITKYNSVTLVNHRINK